MTSRQRRVTSNFFFDGLVGIRDDRAELDHVSREFAELSLEQLGRVDADVHVGAPRNLGQAQQRPHRVEARLGVAKAAADQAPEVGAQGVEALARHARELEQAGALDLADPGRLGFDRGRGFGIGDEALEDRTLAGPDVGGDGLAHAKAEALIDMVGAAVAIGEGELGAARSVLEAELAGRDLDVDLVALFDQEAQAQAELGRGLGEA